MRRTTLFVAGGLAAALLATFAVPAAAKPRAPQRVPIARLHANLERTVAADPGNSRAWLALARLDAMRWSYPAMADVGVYGAIGTNGVPSFPAYTTVMVQKPTTAKPDPALRDAATTEFRKALAADPSCALCALGLGSILELASPPDVAGSLDAYRKAYALAHVADEKREYRGPWNDLDVSEEAAARISAILTTKGPLTKEETKELGDMNAALAAFRAKPRVISPIVFGFVGARSLADLLAPAKTSAFDLDTLGGSRWPWVKPTTAFLVWDPRGTGRVADGAQLFGNVTWNLWFRDGYAALSALDDDADGFLTGRELTGISVWRDLNGNGISDPGEVQSAAGYWAIDRIAVRAQHSTRDGVPFAAEGIRFHDGWTVPTWDWTPEAIAPPTAGF